MEVSFEMIQKSRKGAGNERKRKEKAKSAIADIWRKAIKIGTRGNNKAHLWCILFADSCDRDAGAPGFKSEL